MPRSFRSTRLAALCLAALCLAALPFALGAQAPSRRLELSDSSRNGARNTTANGTTDARNEERPAAPRAAGITPPRATDAAVHNANFVRDQTVLGALVYAPAFSMTVARDGVPVIATYLVVGAGTYFAASDYARHHEVSAVASDFATGGALRGALAGWAVAQATRADSRSTAGGAFIGSVVGMAGGLVSGGRMTEGEAAATRFGGDLLATVGYGFGSAAGGARAGRDGGAAAVGAALVGLPLGYLYASHASYRVTDGDVTTLWTSSAIGAAAAGAFIANGTPSRGTTAAVLAGGALAGAFVGDRLLVRAYDHTQGEGYAVALGAAAGGVMGAGVGMLTAAAHERMSAVTVGFGAAGAIGGLLLSERYLVPRGDAGRALSRLELNPAGAIGVASGHPGAYPLARWTF